MLDIKEYLKQTKTVLVTQDAFEELVKRASAQPDNEALDDAYAHGYTAAESEFRKRMEKPERKKGEWELQTDHHEKHYGWYICSECGAWVSTPTNFCSECGADMRGKEDV